MFSVATLFSLNHLGRMESPNDLGLWVVIPPMGQVINLWVHGMIKRFLVSFIFAVYSCKLLNIYLFF